MKQDDDVSRRADMKQDEPDEKADEKVRQNRAAEAVNWVNYCVIKARFLRGKTFPTRTAISKCFFPS